MTGRNLHRVIGVSFGLLCVLQAALNICLRLIIYSEAPNGTAEEKKEKFDKLEHVAAQQRVLPAGGADLAIINSRAEQAFLENFKMTLWIGLMEQGSERTWRWVDGTPLTESYWSLDTVSNDAGDARIRTPSTAADVKMTGRNLHRVIGVSFGLLCVLQAALNICLRLIIYSEAPNGTAEERNKFDKLDPYFQQGWFHFQKSLYYISSVKNTWHLSREYCLQEGADLAIINSRAEQAFLENFKMTLWIGLMEQGSEGMWRWVDGTPLTESLYYISSVKNTWYLSREYCLQEEADLAIINSRAEQAFLENFKMNLWIGLMEQESEGTWRWVDGTPLTESYWILGEPNNHRGSQEDCVEHFDRDGKKGWNDLVFNSGKANREVEMTLLQTSYNMTKERDQIQTSYTHAIAEKYQLRDNLTKQTGKLQTSYNNLMKEKEQLQTSYNNLITERDQLQKRNNKLTKDNDHLQTSYNHLNTSQNWLENLTKQRDQLQTGYNNVTKELDQLQSSYIRLVKEKDQIQTSYDNLVKEKDQIQTSHNSLKQERDQLQTSHNDLIRERHQLEGNLTRQIYQLQTSYDKLVKENDQIQTSYDNLAEEKDQIQTGHKSLKQERDQLQTSHNDLIRERHQLEGNLTRQIYQLQTSHNDLIRERHQLEGNLTRQIYQLQTSYDKLVKEKDQIQTSYDNLAEEKDQIQTNYFQRTQEKNQLQQQVKELSTAAQEVQKKLQDSIASLERLTEERANLKRSLNNPGWVYFSGSLYQVSSTKKTWDQSRSDCRQKGADLLIINSEEEQAFANRFQKYMWIGLTDVTNEGSWKWVDGTAMSTSYWSSKEPNGGKDENCGDIKNFNAEKSWNDESCSLSLFWICEKKLFQ
ncbi:CD209 antigen-like protein D DC-SIGN-related protein 3 [Takifugu flavidus]|uniref:CD209 antigen-like protein D DC-SIGN-related protein 3 n=2 Tax=Takifugu TaxID=31032 RepID=A0A5C6MWL7_9TELE|nr:CD209 antigen-like protein D DC-SIGN-related protein 3 [Takifugu flavidus]